MVSDFTKAEALMEYNHWRIHRGELFFINDVQSGSAPVIYQVTVGGLPVHFFGSLTVGSKVTYQLLENANISANGTPIPAQNFNRTSIKTLQTTIFRGPTYTGGIEWRAGQAGFGTSPGQAQTGATVSYIEYILKPNTSYVFIHTPATSTDMVFSGWFYEVTSVD